MAVRISPAVVNAAYFTERMSSCGPFWSWTTLRQVLRSVPVKPSPLVKFVRALSAISAMRLARRKSANNRGCIPVSIMKWIARAMRIGPR